MARVRAHQENVSGFGKLNVIFPKVGKELCRFPCSVLNAVSAFMLLCVRVVIRDVFG